MYKQFYGLTRNPFDISPNPYFYYPTPRHNEALANLWHGIQHRKGCVVLTGEVGTGKTMLIRHVMGALSQQQVQHLYVFNPRITPEDFLDYLLTGLGVKTAGLSRGKMLLQLQEFLIGVYQQRSTCVLIVDESHLLSGDMLEEIRLLTNLETAQQKLLQILLVGQPELARTLERSELRQLKQRITLRCRLEPLTEQEVSGYILRRLQRAGATGNATSIFSPAAVAQIMRFSRGVPRVINTICESSLVAGYARQFASIGPDIVEAVAADFCLAEQSQEQPEPILDGLSAESTSRLKPI